jgi:hypothetical protein
MRQHLCIALLCLMQALTQAALAQQSPPPQQSLILRNSGEPLRVPFTCSEEEIQSVGLLCTEDEPCSIYLELNGLATAGKKFFLAGNLHSSSATISSIILASDDAGATWKEPSPRLRGASLDQLEFYDLEHGWAAGELQYPLPRDPFFLLSTDGGNSWRKQQVTEDGGAGALQRFWFDSPQHGELIVDAGRSAVGGRYLDWESETGGESWSIRSSTGEPPKMKRAPPVAENSDFRLRASADGKAYHVEKRLEEKWEPVASFLIEVASCKIKAMEAKEPPPATLSTEPAPEKDDVEEPHSGGDGKGAKAPAKAPVKSPVKKITPPA